MSHKPTHSEAVFSALPGHHVLALEGPDAAKFAQAQFMGDVAQLGDGQWQWNGWLTPKGRVIALFALLRFDATRIWLLLPDADPDALAVELRRFVFRSKLGIESRPDLHVSGAMDDAQVASGAHVVAMGDSVELDMGGDGGGRSLRIATTPQAVIDDRFAAAWTAADLLHGLPRLPPGDGPQWTPQQLSLDRLRAYSVRKGCYPGQEIVARTHFLGQAKRGLALLLVAEARSAPAPGAALTAHGNAAGVVASAVVIPSDVAGANGSLALAVMPTDLEGELAVAGHAAQRLVLHVGLER